MKSQSKNEETGRKLFEQFMDIYVVPEIKRRQQKGELEMPFNLKAFQIIFFSDYRERQIRLNPEVKAIVECKHILGLQKKLGEPIYIHEIEEVKKIQLTEEDDPDCGHITFIKIGEKCIIGFDARYNKSHSKKHIDRAKEFLEAAEFSLKQNNWSAFVDTLFSSAELLARSILLSMPDPKFREKASHKTIKSKFNKYAAPGNVKPIHIKTFNKLSDFRKRARYLKGDFSISEKEAIILLDTVRNMINDASRLVSDN